MAVKTTKIQCNQDVDLRGKADIEGKVTCGGNVEVDGSLTINSASDLKTKDGSSIGGGGGLSQPWFSSNEYIGIKSKSDPSGQVEDFVSGLYNIDGIVGLISQNISTGVVVLFIPTTSSDSPLFLYQYDDVNSMVALPDNFFTESTTINLGDIAKKQSALYRHTVSIASADDLTRACFTAESEKNTPIDSIQDLVAVFGNTSLGCFGVQTVNGAFASIITNINIGTSISDTTIDSQGTGASDNGSFTQYFGTSGFTITDNVTAM